MIHRALHQDRLMSPLVLLALLVLSLQANIGTSFSANGKNKMSGPPFAINVKFSVKPERRDEFLRVMQNNAKQTMSTEPAALQFTLGEDIDTPNLFYLHEEYATQQDHRQLHSKTKHYDECMKLFATEPFWEPVQADEFTLNHDAPSEKIPFRAAYCLNVELCIKPEIRAEFLKVIQNNKEGSDQEPLCMQYSYGESMETPNSFYFHEQYTGNDEGLEGFEAHAAAPHFKVWEEFASEDPFTKPPVVQKFKTIM